MNIINFVDSRWRDAFGGSLIHYYLRESGARVWSISFDLWDAATTILKPDAVILNHMIGRRNKEIAHRVRRNKGKVIILPTEGRPDTNEQKEWFYGAHREVDLFLAWDEALVPENANAVVTGCPRFDIYSNKWKHLIDSRERAAVKHGLDPVRPTLVFFSSFPQAKFSVKNVQFNINDWKDLGISDTISSRSDPLAFARLERKSLLKFQSIIAQFAQFTGWQIAVKPHPMEDMADWEWFCDRHGVSLITQEYAFNALALADTAVNRVKCITSIDAVWNQSPVVQFVDRQPKPGPGRDLAEGMPHGSTFGQLEKKVDIGYITTSPRPEPVAQKCAREILNIIDTNNKQNNERQLNHMIAKHSRNNLFPSQAIQPGKAFTQGVLLDWLWRIENA